MTNEKTPIWGLEVALSAFSLSTFMVLLLVYRGKTHFSSLVITFCAMTIYLFMFHILLCENSCEGNVSKVRSALLSHSSIYSVMITLVTCILFQSSSSMSRVTSFSLNFCPQILLHTTLIIVDVNILTVWHLLAYWPVGDQVFMAVILVSRWSAGGPGAGSAGALSANTVVSREVLRTGTKNQTRRGLLRNAMGRPTKC